MNRNKTEYPLTPRDATAILQVHLAIHRMKGYSGYKYQYQLFVDGKSRDNQVSSKEYQYGTYIDQPKKLIAIHTPFLFELGKCLFKKGLVIIKIQHHHNE